MIEAVNFPMPRVLGYIGIAVASVWQTQSNAALPLFLNVHLFATKRDCRRCTESGVAAKSREAWYQLRMTKAQYVAPVFVGGATSGTAT